MADKRIYVVTETTEKGVAEKLVKAATAAQAVRHVVVGRFDAEPAKPDDVVRLMTAGVRVVEAGAE